MAFVLNLYISSCTVGYLCDNHLSIKVPHISGRRGMFCNPICFVSNLWWCSTAAKHAGDWNDDTRCKINDNVYPCPAILPLHCTARAQDQAPTNCRTRLRRAALGTCQSYDLGLAASLTWSCHCSPGVTVLALQQYSDALCWPPTACWRVFSWESLQTQIILLFCSQPCWSDAAVLVLKCFASVRKRKWYLLLQGRAELLGHCFSVSQSP